MNPRPKKPKKPTKLMRYEAALKKIESWAQGMNENVIDYRNCFKGMKYEAREALQPKCPACGAEAKERK